MSDPRLGVLCCAYLHIEVAAALRRLGGTEAEIACFSSCCHLAGSPEPTAANQLDELAQRTDGAVALCLNCAYVPAERIANDGRVSLVRVETQAALVLGADATEQAVSEGCFIVLPGWAKRWREIVTETWGFDRDTARSFFGATSRRILALDTLVHPLDREALAALGEFLGLPVDVRVTGISHLEALLGRELDRRRQALALESERIAEARSSERAAQHAAIVDFVTSMGDLLDEADVLAHATDLLAVLFGPRGGVQFVPPEQTARSDEPTACSADADDDGRSIHITLGYAGEPLGCFELADLPEPASIPRYLPLAKAIGDATAMALHAARAYRRERRLREQLANKVEELDSFVSVAAHDMRQPLTTGLGYADLLLQLPDATRDQRMLWQKRLFDSMSLMRTLLDDLLTLAQVGRVESMTERVDLGELVERMRGELAELLEEHSVKLRVLGPLSAVRATPRWVHMVFHNLVTNAIKYNDAPIPTIEIGQLPPQPGIEGHAMTPLFVRDNGIGIEPEEAARAFDLFRRLSNAGGRPGTGVGLAIVRKAVLGEGGRVWLESAIGQGTTVYFTLPIDGEAAGPEPPSAIRRRGSTSP